MPAKNHSASALGRRRFLQTTAGLTAAAALGATTDPARAAGPDEFATWFENVDNYEGVVNRTGQETVTVAVGAAANGGAFGFGPAAIRVDPGTTVVWEWTGEGGSHNVVAADGTFESPLQSGAGDSFEHTFDADGAYRYSCVPHEAMGMKGAVVVGDVDVGAAPAVAEPDYGDWFDGVDNFDGTVDATGQDEVRIAVGAPGNGGNYAFEPAAVRVDPGTTVVWEWTGDGGTHDVTDADHGYGSDPASAAGHTYAMRFDGTGVSEYACTPHEAMGMRGAVVVGDPAAGAFTLGTDEFLFGGGMLAAFLSPFAFGAYLYARGTGDEPDRESVRRRDVDPRDEPLSTRAPRR